MALESLEGTRASRRIEEGLSRSFSGEDLREPLVRPQGSQVSMRVARGSASWLSSHGIFTLSKPVSSPVKWGNRTYRVVVRIKTLLLYII